MVATATALAKQLGDKAVVYEAPADITDSDSAMELKKRRAKGWYDPETGQVHVNIAAHKDAADVARTILHEIGPQSHRTVDGPRALQ
jgi:antirestriction protein ArdC